MDAIKLYKDVSYQLCGNLTRRYSTSFSLGISFFKKKHRPHIYAIYAFARLADEIVDTFLDKNREDLLNDFKRQTWESLDQRISTNPVLHAFQSTYHQFNIEKSCVESFLHSMTMDLADIQYDRDTYEKYILGSAEVIGLMCLSVFVEGNKDEYEKLKPSAMKLGAAFQKVNFLRDLSSDSALLNRSYFPGIVPSELTSAQLNEITDEIRRDFEESKSGIIALPFRLRYGVYMAYRYYLALLNKIEKSTLDRIKSERVRIPNWHKAIITLKSIIRININRI